MLCIDCSFAEAISLVLECAQTSRDANGTWPFGDGLALFWLAVTDIYHSFVIEKIGGPSQQPNHWVLAFLTSTNIGTKLSVLWIFVGGQLQWALPALLLICWSKVGNAACHLSDLAKAAHTALTVKTKQYGAASGRAGLGPGNFSVTQRRPDIFSIRLFYIHSPPIGDCSQISVMGGTNISLYINTFYSICPYNYWNNVMKASNKEPFSRHMYWNLLCNRLY